MSVRWRVRINTFVFFHISDDEVENGARDAGDRNFVRFVICQFSATITTQQLDLNIMHNNVGNGRGREVGVVTDHFRARF